MACELRISRRRNIDYEPPKESRWSGQESLRTSLRGIQEHQQFGRIRFLTGRRQQASRNAMTDLRHKAVVGGDAGLGK